jgi:hypothetical protein
VPRFQGSETGIFLGDIADIDPNEDWITVLSLFFTQAMFDKMLTATNSFGQLYDKKWKPVTGNEMQAFLGLIIHMGLINCTGERPKLWANTWKRNVFVRSVMSNVRFEEHGTIQIMQSSRRMK